MLRCICIIMYTYTHTYIMYVCTCRRTEQGYRQRWQLRTPNFSRKIGNYRRGIIKSDGEEHTAHIFNAVDITVMNLNTLKIHWYKYLDSPGERCPAHYPQPFTLSY